MTDRIPSENERRCPACPAIYPIGSDQWGILRQRFNGRQCACKACCARLNAPTRYPDVPGSKTGGASAEAARKMERFAQTLDYQLLLYLSANGPVAPDDYAKIKGLDVLNARPIFSRCKKRGHVEKLNADAQSKLKNSAHYYGLTPAGPAVTQQQGEAA
jgi:hypothetical protein